MKKQKNSMAVKDGLSFFGSMKEDMTLLKDNFKLISHNLKQIQDFKLEKKHRAKLFSLKLNTDLAKMKETKHINMHEMISDTRYLQSSKFRKIKFKLQGKEFCNVVVFMPHNQDLMRVFPFYKSNIIDVNGQYYMFSPKAFRYINGIATLYFWFNMPYAVLMYPNNDVYQPSIDTQAFTSVMKSKFIQDAVSGGEDIKMGLLVAVLVLMILVVIAQVVNIIFTTQLDKKLKAIAGGG